MNSVNNLTILLDMLIGHTLARLNYQQRTYAYNLIVEMRNVKQYI